MKTVEELIEEYFGNNFDEITPYSWIGNGSRAFHEKGVKNFEDLIKLLEHRDVHYEKNGCILAIRMLGELGDKRAIEYLLKKLNDKTKNELHPATPLQCEEDEVIYVCATAAESLAMLGYGENVMDVYVKAKKQGYDVVGLVNLYYDEKSGSDSWERLRDKKKKEIEIQLVLSL